MPTPDASRTRDLASNEWSRFLAGLADPVFLGLAAMGFTAWLLPRPSLVLSPGVLLLKAGIEEAAFRAGLQQLLAELLPERVRLGPLGQANLLAAAAFALAHLVSHPPLWAGLVFLPALGFGLIWDRHRSLPLCALLHFLYNFLLFARP